MMKKSRPKTQQKELPPRIFVVRISDNWCEIRESFTKLRYISTHMYIKTRKTQRKYETVGFNDYGEPIRKLSKETRSVPTNIKVTQNNIIGGRVIGMVSFRELYYNKWLLNIGSLYPKSFIEVPAFLHPQFRDSNEMSKCFPTYVSVPKTS